MQYEVSVIVFGVSVTVIDAYRYAFVFGVALGSLDVLFGFT